MTHESIADRADMSDEDFRALADSIPHIVWTALPDGSTDYFNRRGMEYTGLPPESAYGWNWLAVVHPDDAERAEREWTFAARTPGPHEVEFRLRRSDGTYRWHTTRGLPLRGPQGEVVKWIGTATDIDDRKKLEDDLREAERRAAENLTLLETLQSAAPIGIGFVDREFRIVRVNTTLADAHGGRPEGQIGRTVAEVLPGEWPLLEPVYGGVLTDGVPAVNIEVSRVPASDPGQRHHWLVSYYPVPLHDQIIGIGIVAVDITDRKVAEQAQRDLTNGAVGAIAATVEARDPYTAGHQRRVAQIAAAVANRLGLDAHDVEGIRIAANIHDVGKVGIPTEILTRPDALRPAEWELVKTHSRMGYDIVTGIAFPWPVAEMILQHHERFDGSGYPRGLHRDEILLGARIIAVADTVEAMASHRPYRPARGLQVALEEITREKARLFDPQVVDACVELFTEGEIQLESR